MWYARQKTGGLFALSSVEVVNLVLACLLDLVTKPARFHSRGADAMYEGYQQFEKSVADKISGGSQSFLCGMRMSNDYQEFEIYKHISLLLAPGEVASNQTI